MGWIHFRWASGRTNGCWMWSRSCCGESTPAFILANVSVCATLNVTRMSRSRSFRASLMSLSRPATATVNRRSGPASAPKAGPSMNALAVAAAVIARKSRRLMMALLSGGCFHFGPRLDVLVQTVGQQIGVAVAHQLRDVVEPDLLDALGRQQRELLARAHDVIEIVGKRHID